VGETVTISKTEYDALRKLRRAVHIACSRGAWTKQREAEWFELTGKQECLWGDLEEIALEADRASR